MSPLHCSRFFFHLAIPKLVLVWGMLPLSCFSLLLMCSQPAHPLHDTRVYWRWSSLGCVACLTGFLWVSGIDNSDI
jgi:hypothetical protein